MGVLEVLLVITDEFLVGAMYLIGIAIACLILKFIIKKAIEESSLIKELRKTNRLLEELIEYNDKVEYVLKDE
ncbi:MAG: hypothetical protein H9872_02045 [Candidatus Cellulosilyticum pullistercoris]|uniref:Uncharacterized protein n=1 Tax=Candidatus Cellulosilyticum pullistercoris TaxID=2838521 RepID=A0A9E2KBF9_9FIRM|nr:hypothetical protein [Candidatus Cellulosilyticum pullistercoris]